MLVAEAPGVELVAVVDPDPEARRYAEATPGYGVLEEALGAVECDAVLVASPPGTHHGVAKAALEAGRHVLCEKPLATTLQDAFDLVETADRAERILMVSQNYRYNAPFRTVQRLVMEGELGDLASIRISCRRDTPDALRSERLQVLHAPPLRLRHVYPPLRPHKGGDRARRA